MLLHSFKESRDLTFHADWLLWFVLVCFVFYLGCGKGQNKTKTKKKANHEVIFQQEDFEREAESTLVFV